MKNPMKKSSKEIQSRASLVKKRLLVQSSSPYAERVFSLLSTLSSQQESALGQVKQLPQKAPG